MDMEVKQVIIFPDDLVNSKGFKIGCGKKCGQTAHATVMAYESAPALYKLLWMKSNKPVIILRCDSIDHLNKLYEQAKFLPRAKVTDSGRTEFNGVPTVTCIAIGPALSSDIDQITQHLKLM